MKPLLRNLRAAFFALFAVPVLVLAGCSGALPALTGAAAAGTAVAAASTVSGAANAATPEAGTLLGLAASNSTTVADLVAKGEEFCDSPKFGKTVALTDAVGGMVSVVSPIGTDAQTAATLAADACKAVDAAAKPVPPPTTVPLNAVPVVKVAAP